MFPTGLRRLVLPDLVIFPQVAGEGKSDDGEHEPHDDLILETGDEVEVEDEGGRDEGAGGAHGQDQDGGGPEQLRGDDGDDGDELDDIHDGADDECAGSDDVDDNDDDAGPLDLHEDEGDVEGDGADEVPDHGQAGEHRDQHLQRYITSSKLE